MHEQPTRDVAARPSNGLVHLTLRFRRDFFSHYLTPHKWTGAFLALDDRYKQATSSIGSHRVVAFSLVEKKKHAPVCLKPIVWRFAWANCSSRVFFLLGIKRSIWFWPGRKKTIFFERHNRIEGVQRRGRVQPEQPPDPL